jgi:hypothetical protein
VLSETVAPEPSSSFHQATFGVGAAASAILARATLSTIVRDAKWINFSHIAFLLQKAEITVIVFWPHTKTPVVLDKPPDVYLL